MLSSLTDPMMPVEEEAQSGTLITFEEDDKMEQAVISGIAFSRDEAKITVHGRARPARASPTPSSARSPTPTSTST